MKFTADFDIEDPLIYYRLGNFYTAHRNWEEQRSRKQLRKSDNRTDGSCGDVEKNKNLLTGTMSYGNKALDQEGWANPCGLAAKWYFNDFYTFMDGAQTLKLKDKSLALWGKKSLFKNIDDSETY